VRVEVAWQRTVLAPEADRIFFNPTIAPLPERRLLLICRAKSPERPNYLHGFLLDSEDATELIDLGPILCPEEFAREDPYRCRGFEDPRLTALEQLEPASMFFLSRTQVFQLDFVVHYAGGYFVRAALLHVEVTQPGTVPKHTLTAIRPAFPPLVKNPALLPFPDKRSAVYFFRPPDGNIWSAFALRASGPAGEPFEPLPGTMELVLRAGDLPGQFGLTRLGPAAALWVGKPKSQVRHALLLLHGVAEGPYAPEYLLGLAFLSIEPLNSVKVKDFAVIPTYASLFRPTYSSTLNVLFPGGMVPFGEGHYLIALGVDDAVSALLALKVEFT